MPGSDDTTILRREWNALFDRIFEAGRKQGDIDALSRIEKMLRAGLERDAARAEPPPRPETERVRLPYGAAKNAVREALAAHPRGTSKVKIKLWCARRAKIQLKMDSITEALKSLSKDEEAENPERGIWKPGPKLNREKLGAATPSNGNSLFETEGR